jgi:hypothetical protein
MWLESLVDVAETRLEVLASPPSWAKDTEVVLNRWQVAIELIADAAIDIEDDQELTEAERIETALLTLQANIERIGWSEDGLAITVPNLLTGEEAEIDIRNLPSSNHS